MNNEIYVIYWKDELGREHFVKFNNEKQSLEAKDKAAEMYLDVEIFFGVLSRSKISSINSIQVNHVAEEEPQRKATTGLRGPNQPQGVPNDPEKA